jgi:DNA-binding CsgD family transcriptional regulator
MRESSELSLLERDEQLAVAQTLLAEAAAGVVRTLVFRGAAGVGKTSLLDEIAKTAAVRGFTVYRAWGDELASRQPFGVLLRLLGPATRALSAHARHVLNSGPGALAVDLLTGTPVVLSDDSAIASLGYSLTWLTTDLAAAGPLLMAVDDAQWADLPSLHVLKIVASGLDDVPLLIAVATRSDPPADVADALDRLSDRALSVPPLTEDAVAAMARAALNDRAEPGFIHELYRATGGNPFLLHELLTALRTRGWSGIDDGAVELGRVAPRTVRRFVLRRLAAAGEGAQRLARAVAVLGEADLHDAARLAELTESEAVAAADRLSAAEVLVAGTWLRFVHPVLQETVRADIPPAHRALAHARAARLVAERGGDPHQVAAHLSQALPRGDPWAVDQLVAAALNARDRGALEAAIALLQRALAEPAAAEVRSTVLTLLGAVQAADGRSEALATLENAVGAALTSQQRARALLEKARALFMFLQPSPALTMLDELDVDDVALDPDLVLNLQGELLATARRHPAARAQALRRLAELRDRSLPPRAGSVAVLANLAASAAEDNARPDTVADLARAALTGGWLLAANSNVIAQVVNALTWVDLLDEAMSVLDDVLATARRRGSLTTSTMAHTVRARVNLRRGAIADAEADARIAHALASEHQWVELLPFTSSHLANALLESGAVEEASRVLRMPDRARAMEVADYEESLGLLHLARASPAVALEHFLSCGRILAARGGAAAPGVMAWRSCASTALIAMGDTQKAASLAREELALAEASRVAGSVITARTALGVAVGGSEGLRLLDDGVTEARSSPRVLARIQALTELGSLLRRSGQPRAARPHLAEALDLARRHGAARLADRCRVELAAAGGRPRREALTGAEALTASERRIAGLVADGMTNRQIAAQLYVSPRTVATHLTHIYQKLGIGGRDDMAAMLGRQNLRPL